MPLSVTELINKVLAYAPRTDGSVIKRAFEFAEKHHYHQKRASGEPYITHPLAVSHMLADLKMDAQSVVAGLLHDTVEDTDATLKDVKKNFGSEISSLVQGVTKLARISGLQSREQKQAENFRRLVLAISDDIRILMIKLCDRLHNMRTIGYIQSDESRRRISLETLEIYAPLAERIGMKNIQEELQNISFSQLNPEAYVIIKNRIDHLHQLDKSIISLVIQDLSAIMKKAQICGTVTGREKSSYSIWRKMQKKNVNFDQLCDVIAFRILVDSVADCYHTLGVIHNEFFVIPGRFKDYISTPKPNNYQSLHTYVIGPNQRQIEIQIRTTGMQEASEYGVAAHWQYKQGVKPKEGKHYRWVRGLLDILEHASGDNEFLEYTKLEMFHDQVFCFTPTGDLFALKKGSTSIDFAYAIHSNIGNHCKGAKINGKLMPLRTELKNGDQVEIVVSPHHTPSPTWERFVVTGKAKTNIRKFLRLRHREKFISLGKEIFAKEVLGGTKKNFEETLLSILDKTHIKEEDFFCSLGEGKLSIQDVLSKNQTTVEASSAKKTDELLPIIKLKPNKKAVREENEISGLISEMVIRCANCCHPVPGEKIVGIVTTGKDVSIHRAVCPEVESFSGDSGRLLDISWGTQKTKTLYTARIFVILSNITGTLGAFSTIVGQKNGNIVDIKIARRSPDFYDLLVDIMVEDLSHLMSIMNSLKIQKTVRMIERL